MKDLFKTIKTITRDYAARSLALQHNGVKIGSIEEVLDIRKGYCEDLYRGNIVSQEMSTSFSFKKEPSILRSEVVRAFHSLKNSKSTGVDQIPAEILKCLGEVGVTMIHDICNKIWDTGLWHSDWSRSVFIPLHKKRIQI